MPGVWWALPYQSQTPLTDSVLTAKALQMAYHTSQTFAEARSAIIDYI